jgi:FkbH-like protein
MVVSNSQSLRQQISDELDIGSWTSALQSLQNLWRTDSSSSTAAYVLSCKERCGDHLSLRTCRLAVLRSFTVEPLFPLLRAGAFLHGIDLTVQAGPFNAHAQEMLDPASTLYAFSPDAVILALQARDLVPQFWSDFGCLSAEEARGIAQNVLQQIELWLIAFRKSSSAHLIIHTLERPLVPGQGILDHQVPGGQTESIEELNHGLRRLAKRFQNVYVLDYDSLIGRHGRENWHDPVKWATTRLPIATACLQHLAKEWLRFVYGVAGQVRKVLVTDLDNTLWGGLAGEEGLSGIQLGSRYPGVGYQNLQRVMIDLERRGILLAINSKNNEADALRILENHSEMLLRPDHFVAMKINWQDKAQNLREIAAELNVGTDSLVFLDDNPVERQRIRSEMPEVEVIELPADPMHYERALRDSVAFERLTLTAEDRVRTERYRKQRGRLELAQMATSLEEFYWSLKQIVTIASVQTDTLSRVAQLTRKTNQFNLTTRRYTEPQVQQMAEARGWAAYSVQVEDRFGDNGIVGVAIVHTADRVCEIDTFLLSCRVIGRTVETAVLSFIAREARLEGAHELRGRFTPTSRNAPASTFFEDHGFKRVSTEGSQTLWSLDLTRQDVECPAWTDLRSAGNRVLAGHGD